MNWWDEKGECRLLHRFNPIRLEYILKHVDLKGKRVLDIGCGGGILAKPLSRLGSSVTGIDISSENIKVAVDHAKKEKLDITYLNLTIEKLNVNKKFDIVIASEVIEHVEDQNVFLKHIAKHMKKGSILFISTINRTVKSLLLTKFAAEYLLNLIPKGTHEWSAFLEPSEVHNMLIENKLSIQELSGIKYNPFTKEFSFTTNLQNNYILKAERL